MVAGNQNKPKSDFKMRKWPLSSWAETQKNLPKNRVETVWNVNQTRRVDAGNRSRSKSDFKLLKWSLSSWVETH